MANDKLKARNIRVRIGTAEVALRCHCRRFGHRYIDRSECYVHGAGQPYVIEMEQPRRSWDQAWDQLDVTTA